MILVVHIMNEYQRLVGNNTIYDIDRWARRDELVKRYAWAIPNDAAITCLVRHSPILEVGAGTGYWASLVAAAGGTVRAFDKAPPGTGINEYGHLVAYHQVEPMHRVRWRALADHTLFLCWPPMSKMAQRVLSRYRGSRVIYVGEQDGCTGTPHFHIALERHWHQVERIEIPQWYGMHDGLYVYERLKER